MKTETFNRCDETAVDDSPVTLVLELGYRGGAYSGFARQKDPHIPTIQREIERALSTLARRDVEIVCAGRTDAGVHARGQVVSCTFERSWLAARSPYKLLVSLNALTPDDIVVKSARFARAGFSARFDATARTYRYRICTGPVPPLFLQDFAWWHRSPLDVDAMREAASHLIGEHDFKSFCKAQSAIGKTTMRNVRSIDFLREEQLGESCLVIEVVGNAFLHSMVRTIVGTLVQVGTGRKGPRWVVDVLEARNRSAAGENAPAQGLTFWSVAYPEGLIFDTLDEV